MDRENLNEKCDQLLSNILCEANVLFASLQADFKKRHSTIDDYVERLGKLTNIATSVKTGLALSNSPMGFFNSSDISKEESV